MADLSGIVGKAGRIISLSLIMILHVGLIHSVIFFAICVLSKGSRSPLPAFTDAGSALKYNAQMYKEAEKLHGKGVVLQAKFLNQITGNWLMVLTAATFAILLYQLKGVSEPSKPPAFFRRIRCQMNRVLCYQLPPRRFWIWWCGGMIVKDLILVSVWLFYTIYWVWVKADSRNKANQLKLKAGKMTNKQAHLSMLQQVGASLGSVSMLQMALLFFPVPRNSFLHHVFQTDFSGLVKYHKWLGWGFLYTILLHATLFYAYWSQNDDSFASQFFSWGKGKANNLAGSISVTFGIAILLTSMQWIRRAYFQVFIRCHIIGFVGFTVFAYLHFWQRWIYQTPGIILLLLDWVYRLKQWRNRSIVTGTIVGPDKSIVTMEMNWKKDADLRPGHYVFLNLPDGQTRTLQWHPVTIADVDRSPSTHTIVKAHMKRYGAWTRSLVAKMLENGQVVVRADGPYGIPSGQGWQKYDILVIIAGGIGATPMLGMLRDIAALRSKAREKQMPGFPRRVILHWSSRGGAEFSLLDAHLLRTSLEEASWLEIQLHSTGDMPNGGLPSCMEQGSLIGPGTFHEVELSKIDNAMPEEERMSPIPPSSTPQLLEPYGAGGFSWLLCHILAFAGAFFALLVVMYYNADLTLTGRNIPQYWKTGCLVLMATSVGAMGLPAGYLMLHQILHSLLAAKKRKPTALASKTLASLEEEGWSLAPALSLEGCQVQGMHGVHVRVGRPDVKSILAEVSNLYSTVDCIGVFVAGPESMIADVSLACANYNAAWNSPYLELSQHAFEL